MPIVTSHLAGSFCWIELATTDLPAARAFYTALFGWSVRETPIGEGDVYMIFLKNDRDVGAMHGHTAGAPPNWLSYVTVDDVDATVAKAKELGGSVAAGPMDVGNSGRMAVLLDNQGAALGVWKPNQHIGVGIRHETATLCWNELNAHDVDAGKRFYPPLFGWRTKESDEYTEWQLGENAVGGMFPWDGPAQVPAFWIPYFAVDDCDATTSQALSLGGKAHVSCMDIEHVGRFSVIVDPQGAAFAIIRLQM